MKEYDETKYILVRKEVATFQKWFRWLFELLAQLGVWSIFAMVCLWSLLQIVILTKNLLIG